MHDCTHIVHVLHWYVTEGNASAHDRKCHEQRWQPPPTAILGFCKANNFSSGALQAFLPIYFGSSWELQLNQAKLFWKLPSPFSLIDLNWAAFWIEIRVYSSRHATYVDCCWYSFTQLIPQSKPYLKMIHLSVLYHHCNNSIGSSQLRRVWYMWKLFDIYVLISTCYICNSHNLEGYKYYWQW